MLCRIRLDDGHFLVELKTNSRCSVNSSAPLSLIIARLNERSETRLPTLRNTQRDDSAERVCIGRVVAQRECIAQEHRWVLIEKVGGAE